MLFFVEGLSTDQGSDKGGEKRGRGAGGDGDGWRASCLREQGGQEGASSCKEKSLHLEIIN